VWAHSEVSVVEVPADAGLAGQAEVAPAYAEAAQQLDLALSLSCFAHPLPGQMDAASLWLVVPQSWR
jgi:hypothetical protein